MKVLDRLLGRRVLTTREEMLVEAHSEDWYRQTAESTRASIAWRRDFNSFSIASSLRTCDEAIEAYRKLAASTKKR